MCHAPIKRPPFLPPRHCAYRTSGIRVISETLVFFSFRFYRLSLRVRACVCVYQKYFRKARAESGCRSIVACFGCFGAGNARFMAFVIVTVIAFEIFRNCARCSICNANSRVIRSCDVRIMELSCR